MTSELWRISNQYLWWKSNQEKTQGGQRRWIWCEGHVDCQVKNIRERERENPEKTIQGNSTWKHSAWETTAGWHGGELSSPLRCHQSCQDKSSIMFPFVQWHYGKSFCFCWIVVSFHVSEWNYGFYCKKMKSYKSCTQMRMECLGFQENLARPVLTFGLFSKTV